MVDEGERQLQVPDSPRTEREALQRQRLHELLSRCREEALLQVVGPFGVTPAMFSDIDGGNVTTQHNANQDIYAKKLAKLANRIAKKRLALGGVCDLTDPGDFAAVLLEVPVGDIWGIGRATVAKLDALGVRTAGQLVALDLEQARQALTIVGARIVQELRGEPCAALELASPARKGTAVTRSFGTPATEWADMRQALAAYASRAAERLRQHGLVASTISVFMHTSKFRTWPAREVMKTTTMLEATADTMLMVEAPLQLGRACWRSSYAYSKAGVILADLVAAGREQRRCCWSATGRNQAG